LLPLQTFLKTHGIYETLRTSLFAANATTPKNRAPEDIADFEAFIKAISRSYAQRAVCVSGQLTK